MKKILLPLLILFIIFCTCIYILIPGEIRISDISKAGCIPKNIVDCLARQSVINRWWPEKQAEKQDSLFFYKGYAYKLTTIFTDGAEIQIGKGSKKLASRIRIIPVGKDSCVTEWQTSVASGSNPFKRIGQYYEASDLKNNMREVLSNLLSFAGKTENIYGFHIERTTFTDTVLFATRFSSGTYPSIETIYDHINDLRKKIKEADTKEKDFPMLNVNQTDSMKYETMIAICVNKEIAGDKNYFVSRMVPMKDRFLKTTVTGGDLTIQKAHEAIEHYMNDHFLSAPAIPFEILVTDRSKETDTSKWKTIIFYPSM